jgi:hypothetical protein
MESLPVIPSSCSLDEAGLTRQVQRYRAAGAGATVIERTPNLIEIEVGGADDETIAELVAVERECCPFYRLDYDRGTRRLTIAVGDEYRPAIEAIAYALGLSDR